MRKQDITCDRCNSHAILIYSGVGIDGGNGKDWESNAKSITLIKQRGKVKVLDEEIHSKLKSMRINHSQT